jgi:hypothetical protein
MTRNASFAGLILVWTSPALLAACGTTSQELRATAREQEIITVELPPSTVHANVIRAASRCYHSGTRVSHFYVRESRAGHGTSTIEVVQDGLAMRIVIAMDIVQAPSGTSITYFVHPRFSIFRTFKPVITGWALGTGTDCGAIT